MIGSSLLAWLAWDIHLDRSKEVRILKTTALYESWESLGGQESASTVEPGENLKIERIRYGKDYMAIKVAKDNGLSGWLIYSSDSVEVQGNGKTN